jgi:hypothetical protein
MLRVGGLVRRVVVCSLAMWLTAGVLRAQESMTGAIDQAPAPIERAPAPQDDPAASPVAKTPVSNYDKSIFMKPVPAGDLDFLKQLAGANSGELFRDKQFKQLMKGIVPDCTFHYGRDMSLADALDMVFDGSRDSVQLREGRYLMLSGHNGQYLSGRGFIWIDLQDGIGLGGFYFHPTNGEPTPALNVFSRQVKDQDLGLSQLPPAFVDDMTGWAEAYSVPPVLTQYFITGGNKKVLLEHDVDYCSGVDTSGGGGCEQMNADAADKDMVAASYVDETRHVTNATAWMLGPEEVSWIGMRDRTCGTGPDPLGCHIRMTREHVHVIMRREPMPHGRR